MALNRSRSWGSNRSFDDGLIAQDILIQIDQSKLSRELPALPNGVRYKSVSVTSAGIAVGLAA